MIKSFADKRTEVLFHRAYVKGLPSDLQRICLRKLVQIHKARRLQDLMIPPANRLEKLKGNRQNQYSIRINNQWRICFCWQQNNAYQFEIVDYH
ncbi:MAG TPA: type II toxin-antitoxin system RelE/ParE family toxin [Alphaproteobacteria bacterium]|nr:type II toxin-antitoxin system RelE/ParE family toxin [Alphaproteobacteria bacterium]